MLARVAYSIFLAFDAVAVGRRWEGMKGRLNRRATLGLAVPV